MIHDSTFVPEDARQFWVLDSESTEEIKEDWLNRFFKAAEDLCSSESSSSDGKKKSKKTKKGKKKNANSKKTKKGTRCGTTKDPQAHIRFS